MITEIPYESHEEWLALRKKYIGGSDAGAVVGLSQYASPYSVWAEKTGRTPEFQGNTETKVGAYLEDFVANLFEEETGKKVRRKNRTLVNDIYPFACANVDRMVVGEKALLEIKTTSSLPVMRRVKDGEYPERWYCQMTHYLAVTGLERAYLAVLVGNSGFYTYTLERDQAEIDALMDAERDFWRCVTEDTPPSPDGTEATADALQVVYAESRYEERDLFGRETILDEYMRLKRQKKAIDERLAEIENILKEDLKEAERGSCGAYSITWKSQVRSTFQVKAFSQAYPDIDLTPFYKQISSRPFKVTEKKNEN